MVEGMAAAGWSDAGTRLPGWLREAGFREVDEDLLVAGRRPRHLVGLRRRRDRERALRTRPAPRYRDGGASSRARAPASTSWPSLPVASPSASSELASSPCSSLSSCSWSPCCVTFL